MKPGLLVLHGNRLESLAEVVFEWLARHPLAPLDEETVLVQSNGMAEWFKMSLAASHGVCAATRVELPARFLWRTYRTVLGRNAVPPVSALDKQPLVWRLMAMLPPWLEAHRDDPVWAPLASALGGAQAQADAPAAAERRLALCQRVADLFDQYQIYRPDWLDDWASGRDGLRQDLYASDARRGPTAVVPADQAWQPALWRAVVAGLSDGERSSLRPALHRRCVEALKRGRPHARAAQADGLPAATWALPQRVLLFGSTQLPQSTLELLAALAEHVQVILAVPNPCRYFWADLIDGREQLALTRRRHPLRDGVELSSLPMQALHVHGHPLLAAWGRQARDFVRQLDAFDDVQRSREQFELPRVDLFDDGPGTGLLAQVQAQIRDGVPLREHSLSAPDLEDRSINFHIAHSAHREVEILHDQLLYLLAGAPGGQPLNPRDIVVMVPEIDRFAASIRAVFGQHPRGSARHIPWGIADVSERGHSPLLQAVEWLLRVPQHRFSVTEWRDLLELPACAQRFGIEAADLPQALDWLAGAHVRWGLHQEHRASMGLGAAGGTASWRFGIERMMLGYAAGELDDGFAGIEPFTEVAGLVAGLAGSLALMLRELQAWWQETREPKTPPAWVACLRTLLSTFFDPQDDLDRAALAALDAALNTWLMACETAGFDEDINLAVAREAWLGSLQEPGLNQRFKAGGVTFCTLLPLRAIPFEVVCLLGMNEGDYPRVAAPADFDLMAMPGMGRPGDRSRRHDDRQLMLDALLSARRVLHISWAGRSQRDNSEQPPSVLVSQLRDYLDAGWGPGVSAQRTVEHPLQPFSRRYFEVAHGGGPQPLFTYANEWRLAHGGSEEDVALPASTPDVANELEHGASGLLTLSLAQLIALLRQPSRFYFRHRLKVVFGGDGQPELQDDESFDDQALERAQCLQDLLAEASVQAHEQPLEHLLDRPLQRLAREGRLPLASAGVLAQEQLRAVALPMLAERECILNAHPVPAPAVHIELDAAEWGVRLSDTVQGLWQDDDAELLAGISFATGDLQGKGGIVRKERLFACWVNHLACAAAGRAAQWHLIGRDSVAVLAPVQPAQAQALLRGLLQAASLCLIEGRPLATAARTGIAWLTQLDGGSSMDGAWREALKAFEGSDFGPMADVNEDCLRRLYPRFADLVADGHFEDDTRMLYGPCLENLAATLQMVDLPVDLPDLPADESDAHD